MRLLICAGGTGGGVYPALSVLRALTESIQAEQMPGNAGGSKEGGQQMATLWVGSVGGMEVDLVERNGIPYHEIPAAGVHGVGLKAMPGNLMRLFKGFLASGRILKSFQPDVLFFTGGYLAVPMALAARLGLGMRRIGSGVPAVLFVPDIEPGLALKTLARFADRICVPAEASRAYFKRAERVSVTGYPVRPDLLNWSIEDARQTLNLVEHLPTVLVTGGSTGAQSINRAVFAALPELLQEMQIVHICGQRNWEEVQAVIERLQSQLPERLVSRYHAYPYLHDEMGAALRSADLVVSRAGASILGEYPRFGLPAIVVPYPHAWRYQQVNAEYLASQGAAIMLPDGDLPTNLAGVVLSVLRDPRKLDAMRLTMQSLARPEAAQVIAGFIGLQAGKELSGS